MSSTKRHPGHLTGLSTLTRAAIVTCVSLATLTAGSSASAEESRQTPDELQQFTGRFLYAGTLDHGRIIVRRAFEDALNQLPPLMRPSLRKQMNRRDYMIRDITIRLNNEGRLSFRASTYKTFRVSSVLDEEGVIPSRNGQATKVMQRFRGDHIVQVLENRRGRARTVFTLRDNGQILHVATTVTSELLERPITVELDYRREPPPPRRDRRNRRGRDRRRMSTTQRGKNPGKRLTPAQRRRIHKARAISLSRRAAQPQNVEQSDDSSSDESRTNAESTSER